MPLLLSTTIFLHFLLLLLFTSAHENCGTKDPTAEDVFSIQVAEKVMFGKNVGEMKRTEISSFFKGVVERKVSRQALQKTDYELVNIPIVYHVLPNMGGSLTSKQADWTTDITNKMFNVYDKVSKESIQFVTFVNNATIVHNTKVNDDCADILRFDDKTFKQIISKATEWKFKFHVIVCQSKIVAGRASFPTYYEIEDPHHNAIIASSNAIGCYDDEGNYLCTLDSNGTKLDYTSWARTRSVVVAHEIGHLFGLFHTFQNGCNMTKASVVGYNIKGDGISDTPFENFYNYNETTRHLECPGLLPYNKDRDLFDPAIQTTANEFSNPNDCGKDAENVCVTSCAACCERNSTDSKICARGLASKVKNPICCTKNVPFNSCPRPKNRGIDPKNNIMTYAADYCLHEVTPGQMMRMIAQVRRYKSFIYCNYGTVEDSEKCRNITCASTATSPNCV